MHFDYHCNLSIEEDQEKVRTIGASIFQFGVNCIYLYKGTCTCLCELDCASSSLEYLRVYHVSYENETGMRVAVIVGRKVSMGISLSYIRGEYVLLIDCVTGILSLYLPGLYRSHVIILVNSDYSCIFIT